MNRLPATRPAARVKIATYLVFIPVFLRLLCRLLQQFQQLAFPHKVAGNFVAVKQDDRDIVAVTLEKLRILRDIHHLDDKLNLRATTINNFLCPVTQVTTWLGVDRNQSVALSPRISFLGFHPRPRSCDTGKALSRLAPTRLRGHRSVAIMVRL